MTEKTLESFVKCLEGTVYDQTFTHGTNPSVFLIGAHDVAGVQWHTIDMETILKRLKDKLDILLFEGYEGRVTKETAAFTAAADIFPMQGVECYFNDDIDLLKRSKEVIESGGSESEKKEIIALRNNNMVYGPYGITKFNGVTAQVVGMKHLVGIMNELERNSIQYFAAITPNVPSEKEVHSFLEAMCATQSPNKSSRTYAAKRLGEYPIVIARRKLQELASDPSAKVTREVVKSLRKLNSEASTDTLVSMLKHSDEETRWLAASTVHDIDQDKKPKLKLPGRLGFALPFYYAGVSDVSEHDTRKRRGKDYNLFVKNVLGKLSNPDTTFTIEQRYEQDRILGSLYGALIGDARGAPFERLTLEYIDRCIGRSQDYSRRGARELADYTDDWEMTLGIIKSIFETQEISINDIATKFSLFIQEDDRSDLDRGYGMAAKIELRKYLAGMPLNSIGSNSNGAGALMRVAPLAACSSNLRDAVFEVSRITHRNHDACCAAYAAAYAIRLAYESTELDPNSFLEQLTEEVAGVNDNLAKRILKLKKTIGMNPEEAFLHIGKTDDDPSKWGKGALNVLELALYSFLHSPGNFEETMQAAIYNDGDSDTIATTAGAISGAYNGVHRIPKHLIDGLYKKERYMQDVLNFAKLIGINNQTTQ